MLVAEELSALEWRRYSEKAHLICFNKEKPVSEERIDFAILVHENHELAAYVTCKEMNAHTVYCQFGGAFPGTKGTVKSALAFETGLKHLQLKYQTLRFAVENDNYPMLKLAMLYKFKINGIRYHEKEILLEHTLCQAS